MPRYYLSDIARDSKGRWRPIILNSEAWPGNGEGLSALTGIITDGEYNVPWFLCTVWAADHEALGAVEGVDLLPDFPIEGLLSEMEPQVFDALRTALIARQIPAEEIDGWATFLDGLTYIAMNVLGATGFIPAE